MEKMLELVYLKTDLFSQNLPGEIKENYENLSG
jgi:hypothetical protein